MTSMCYGHLIRLTPVPLVLDITTTSHVEEYIDLEIKQLLSFIFLQLVGFLKPDRHQKRNIRVS